MAEQDTEDTKSPAAPRRAARPFIGPAGASGQPTPLLRTAPSLSRPPRAPFVPAVPAATRAPLGSAKPAVETTEPTPSPSATAPDSLVARAPVEEPVETPLTVVVPTEPPSTTELPAAEARADRANAHDATVEDLGSQGLDASPYDRFAAFDAAWQDAVVQAPERTAPPSAALDVESLGSVSDAVEPWDADVPSDTASGPAAAREDDSLPAWLMDDVQSPETPDAVVPTPPAAQSDDLLGIHSATAVSAASDAPQVESVDDGWAEVARMPSADAVMAAGHSAMDAVEHESAAAAEVPTADQWPDQLLAEYAPYVAGPTPSTAAASPLEATPVDSAPVAKVDEGAATDAAASNAEPVTPVAAAVPTIGGSEPTTPESTVATNNEEQWTHELRVSAALDRLAERVRAGEIDVSSVAPGAPDAAMLASVLAALLGGGRSSSH